MLNIPVSIAIFSHGLKLSRTFANVTLNLALFRVVSTKMMFLSDIYILIPEVGGRKSCLTFLFPWRFFPRSSDIFTLDLALFQVKGTTVDFFYCVAW